MKVHCGIIRNHNQEVETALLPISNDWTKKMYDIHAVG